MHTTTIVELATLLLKRLLLHFDFFLALFLPFWGLLEVSLVKAIPRSGDFIRGFVSEELDGHLEIFFLLQRRVILRMEDCIVDQTGFHEVFQVLVLQEGTLLGQTLVIQRSNAYLARLYEGLDLLCRWLTTVLSVPLGFARFEVPQLQLLLFGRK